MADEGDLRQPAVARRPGPRSSASTSAARRGPRGRTSASRRRSCGSWPTSTIGAGALVVGGGMFFVIFAMASSPAPRSASRASRGSTRSAAQLHRVRLGGQHPGDHPAHRRRRPGRHGRRRLHRPAGRHAHLRRDRRPRGDGVRRSVPGRHPGVGGADHDDPAVPGGPSRTSPPADRHRVLRPGAGPTATTSACSCRRSTCSVLRQGPGLRRRRHPHPLLLRLLRHRRPGGRGRGRRPGDPHQHRRDQRASTCCSRWRSGAPPPL